MLQWITGMPHTLITIDPLFACYSKKYLLVYHLSSFLNKSTFFYIKFKKSKYHSDDHLEACLRLATTSHCPDYTTLANLIQCKSSELDSEHKCIQLCDITVSLAVCASSFVASVLWCQDPKCCSLLMYITVHETWRQWCHKGRKTQHSRDWTYSQMGRVSHSRTFL